MASKQHTETAKDLAINDLKRAAPFLLRRRELEALFFANKLLWGFPKRYTFRAFEGFLLGETEFCKTVLDFPSRPETRYSWGRPSIYPLAMSLRPGAYFTHYTAMSLHDLTDQLPRTIYLNAEQRPKRVPNAALAQERIDSAFARKPRVSQNTAQYGDYRICVLNGMFTGGRGAIELQDSNGDAVRTTGLERTLIDIAVRPFYSGGVFEVLEAYRRARGAVDVELLADTLRALDYTYPYHQAVGFYMERAGFPAEDLEVLRSFPFEYDFYLTFQTRNPDYSQRWRLFFPRGM